MSKIINIVKHNNKSIVVMDYTKCSKEELCKSAEEVMAWMKSQPKESLLTITDFTNQHFDKNTVEEFKKLAAHNKPYVKAGALIGISGLLKIAYLAISKFSGRNMPIFENRQEAMDWLVTQ